MTTSEKVAYLKGLVEGLGLDRNEKEGKVLSVILDILEDLSYDVEDILFGDDEDDWDDEDDELEEGDEVLDDENLVLYEAQCPTCGETVTFEESVLEQGGIACPNCGESLEFDLGKDDAD